MSRWKIGMILLAVGICIFGFQPCLDWAIISCAADGKTSLVRVLLRMGSDPNTRLADPGYAIRQAAAFNHSDALRSLLNADGNPDTPSESGETALILASGQGNLNIVRILLAAKANPNLDDGDGTKPLEYANKYPDVVKVLKQSGAKL